MTSVCMATYNGERFIKEQIDSILCQLSPDDELIISDDGSTDRTLELIASYNGKRIKVLHHKKNPKLAKVKCSYNFYYATENFENALKEAKGDYIFLSDQDDVWLPGKKEKMIAALEQNGADCVMCNFSLIDADGEETGELGFQKCPKLKNAFSKIIQSRLIGSSMAFKKEVLDFALPFPKNLIAHDLWIGCLAKKMIFVDEPLTLYRRYGGNVSSGTGKSPNSFFYKIVYRLKFLQLVLVRKLFGAKK